jgi:hypothetical protein
MSMTTLEWKSNEQPGIVITFWKVRADRLPSFHAWRRNFWEIFTMLHSVCAQPRSTTKTQGNLVYPGFSKPRTDEDPMTWDIWSFVANTGHNGPVRVRNTNLSVISSKTMWSQPVLIELLAALLLLQVPCTFPPLPLVISHWQHIFWRVRVFYYTKYAWNFRKVLRRGCPLKESCHQNLV